MTATANQIELSDQIIASIEVGGTTLASVARSGFSSTDEVVRTLKALAGNFIGLARLNIRNKTHGWNQLLALVARRRIAAQNQHITPHIAGRQYSIQWP